MASEPHVHSVVLLMAGHAGSGKDTICQQCFPNVTRLSFADDMKRQVSEAFNVPLYYFHDRDLKDNRQVLAEHLGDNHCGRTPRDLLIEYAAERRRQDAHYFTKSVAKEIGLLYQKQQQQQQLEDKDDDDDDDERTLLQCGPYLVSIVATVADCRFENEVEYVDRYLDSSVSDGRVHVVSCWVDRPTLDSAAVPADNTQITRDHCHMTVVNDSVPFDTESMVAQLKRGLAAVLNKRLHSNV